MLYLAELFLLEENLTFSKHSAVHSAFGERFVKTKRVPVEFHRYLISGQEMRQIGDYGADPVGSEESQRQIDRAKEFIDFTEKYY